MTKELGAQRARSTDNVGVTGYKVFRDAVQIGTTPNAAFTDTGVTASTMYSYTVSAYDASCSSNNTLPSGITFSSCTSVPGTTISYAFTGSLAVGASIALYYGTNNTCAFTNATNVEVVAATCP